MTRIKVLHLANDFSGSSVYKNLCESLDKIGVEQTIYVAVRSKRLINRNIPVFTKGDSRVIFRNILNNRTRFNFYGKINKITNDLIHQVDVKHIDLVHAHTWYSDGAVAYRLKKAYNIPYILAIRSTDYNLFFRYFIFLRKYGLRILENASRIIFISPNYKEKVISHRYFTNHLKMLTSKGVVVPNGIDQFWIDSVEKRKPQLSGNVKLIYIGQVAKRKNVLSLVEAVTVLKEKGIDCRLSLVGGAGDAFQKVMERIKEKDYISYEGMVNDKQELKQLMLNSDIFVMPSRAETFGLVYIEALSQGIPVIYTINEGIFGLYDNRIGEAVNWKNIKDIADGIEKIIRNYLSYDFVPSEIVRNHDWNQIALTYFKMYKESIKI